MGKELIVIKPTGHTGRWSSFGQNFLDCVSKMTFKKFKLRNSASASAEFCENSLKMVENILACPKVGHSLPLFLYFHLFYRVIIGNSIKWPMAGFEPGFSGVGSDHSLNFVHSSYFYKILPNLPKVCLSIFTP